MKHAWWLPILAALALAAVAPAAGAAEIETYVGCDASFTAAPAESCQFGDSPGAFFESDEEVEYDVCVEFPDGEFLCAEEQQAEAEVLYVNQITTEAVGTHYVWWYVNGLEVGSWSFRIEAPPTPPTPAPPAVPPPPAPTVVLPSAACVNAKTRVQSLGKKVAKAAKPKRKARLREKLKRARAAKKRLC